MTKLNIGMLSSLKVLIITLFLLIPVGITLAMNDHQESGGDLEGLPPAEPTTELGFKPIEIESMRSAESKTFDNGDGSYKAVLYTKPIHYQDENGDWQDMDESEPSYGSRSSSREIAVLQPGQSDGKDTIISDQGNADMNIGGDAEFWFTGEQSTAGFLKFRILLQFNIASLNIVPNAEISSSKLSLKYFRSQDGTETEAGASTPISMKAYPITRSWVEGTGLTTGITHDGATWNDYDGTLPWGSVGGDYSSTIASPSASTPTSYGWTDVNVLNIVKAWVDGSITNFGFILISNDNHAFLKKFRSSEYTGSGSDRPKLEIDYISNKPPEVKNYITKYELNEDASTRYLNLDSEQYIDGIFKDPDVDDELDFFIWNGLKWAGYISGGAYESDNLTATVQQNGTLEIVLKPNKYGTDTIRLNATDLKGASVIHNMNVQINSVNDPPRIYDTTKWTYDDPEPSYSTGTLTCKEDQWSNFTVKANDPIEPEDNSKLKYYINSTEDYAPFFIISVNNGQVAFEPTNDDVGIYYLKITVDDTGSVFNIDEYSFTLEIENVNDKPIITEFASLQFSQKADPFATSITLTESLWEDSYFNFTVYANDEDLELEDSEEHIKFSIMPSNRFSLIRQTPTPEKHIKYSFLPTNDDVGVYTAQVSVSDRDNADTTLELKLNVRNVNDPPMINTFYFGTQIKDLEEKQYQMLDLEDLGKVYTATEKIAYSFNLKGIDIDLNDELEFEVEIQNRTKGEQQEIIQNQEVTEGDNPDEVSSTIDLTIIPDLQSGHEGEIWLNVTVTDKLGEEGLLMLRIPVENINDPPPRSTIDVEINDADRGTREKENLSVIFNAELVMDPDGDNLTYSWDFDYTDGIGEDATGAEIVWTFPDGGEYVITLTVDDNNGGTNTSTKKIQVLKPPKKDSDDGDGGLVLGSVAGIQILYILILIIIVIVVLISVAMVTQQNKKKKAAEEAAAAAEAQQAQMMAQTQFGYPMAQTPDMGYYQDPGMMTQDPAMMAQDPAMMAQYQALQQQQLMQQYPAEYQQMMAQQYGNDQMAMMEQLEGQPYAAAGAEAGMGVDAYGQPIQTMPMQSATLAGGQPAGELGLPAAGQPQLPPPQLGEVGEGAPGPAAVEPEVPESPFASAQTQTLEEEIGTDTEVAEVPMEPDTSVPEPEVAPPEVGAVIEEEQPPPQAPEPTQTPIVAGGPSVAAGPTVAEPEPAGPGEGGAENKCNNCGATVKEGWFLCPQCKQPLI